MSLINNPYRETGECDKIFQPEKTSEKELSDNGFLKASCHVDDFFRLPRHFIYNYNYDLEGQYYDLGTTYINKNRILSFSEVKMYANTSYAAGSYVFYTDSPVGASPHHHNDCRVEFSPAPNAPNGNINHDGGACILGLDLNSLFLLMQNAPESRIFLSIWQSRALTRKITAFAVNVKTQTARLVISDNGTELVNVTGLLRKIHDIAWIELKKLLDEADRKFLLKKSMEKVLDK